MIDSIIIFNYKIALKIVNDRKTQILCSFVQNLYHFVASILRYFQIQYAGQKDDFLLHG